MGSVNTVFLLGNLGADPESRTTDGGLAICNLRLATNERRKTKSGDYEDHTEWHRVVAFGKTAENCARYLQKGRQVHVQGRLSTNKWTDKDGNDRYTTEIKADRITFVGGNGEVSSAGGSGRSGYDKPGPDSDLPF